MTKMRIDVRRMMDDVRRMMRELIIVLMLCVGIAVGQAQVFETAMADGSSGRATENVVVAEGFWKNWFVQMDLDMTLQNPYGYDFSNVFPNGKSFGLDVAVGKWFTPIVGMRGKFNWENKLPLLENKHANWLAPFYKPGVNREKGGYIAFYADVLMNMHNLFGSYRQDRTWNLNLYPRIGVNYNFGVSKGALIAGIGVLNTYRLSERWSLYADVAYIMTGSGFVGKESKADTGTGSNSNGYLSIGIGAQYDLGKVKRGKGKKVKNDERSGVPTNGFWDNWFVQAGLDISLMNPYGCNFSEVFPKGNTFGLNVAMGKWFTPEFALRGRVNWENGLIENKQIEWVPPTEDPRKNYSGGGYLVMTLEPMLNLTNVIKGYEPEKKWHTSLLMRMGIISQLEIGSGSPLFGGGIEQTYRLNDKLSLFGSVGYQVTTSESSGGRGTGMDVATGNNGFFDIDFGVVYDLGDNKFWRGNEEKSYRQPYGSHNLSRFLMNTIGSVGVAHVGKTALKAMVKEERPDHSDNKSFPSGHTAMAFAAARSIDKEFRKDCIWIPIAGYAAATAVGIERVTGDRHHWYDVVAGAGIGIAATELTWWLNDQIIKKENVRMGVSGNSLDVAIKL